MRSRNARMTPAVKRVAVSLLTVILCVSSLPFAVYAQTDKTTSTKTPTPAPPASAPATPSSGSSLPSVGSVVGTGLLNAIVPGSGAAVVAATAIKAGTDAAGITTPSASSGDNVYCSALNPFSWPDCFARGIAYIIISIGSFFLGIAGALLNWVIIRAVFQFSLLIGNSPGLLAAWGILRDLGNMLLLFGFIFIGLATILDIHTYAAKRTLPKLILFAILMNFSLFAAEGVIDVSNGLTSAIYNQSNATNCVGNASVTGGVQGGYADSKSKNASGVAQCSSNFGLAGQIMQSTGISSIFDWTQSTNYTTASLFGLAVLSFIAAVVIFAAAIMLLIRAVMLTFLMVFAPIGFAGMAIPPLEGVAREWWNRLIHQAFFAPILFLMIFVSLKISNSIADPNTRTSLAAALSNGDSGTMGVLMVFGIVITFLVGSLIAAKKFGAMGATFATNLGSKFVFGGFARGANLAVGGSSFLARKGIRRWAPDNKLASHIGNRYLQRLQGANLDLRRVGGGALLGAMGATTGAQASGHSSFDDMRHRYKEVQAGERGKELDKLEEIERKKLKLKREAKEIADPSHARTDLSVESQQFLASLSAEAIAADHDLQHSLEGLASKLSADQFDGLMKSDKLKQNVKDSLAKSRFDAPRKELAAAKASVDAGNGFTNEARDMARNLTNKDLELLAKYDAEAYKKLIELDDGKGGSLLLDDQLDHLGKASAITDTQRTLAKNNTKGGRVNNLVKAGNSTAAAVMAQSLTTKNKAKLWVDTLRDAEIIQTFTPGDLEAIQREQKLNADDISAIMTEIDKLPKAKRDPLKKWINEKNGASGYWRK